MNVLAPIAHRSMLDVLKVREDLPRAVWALFSVMHKIRWVWYSHQALQQLRTHQKPKTALNLIAGHTFEVILGKNTIIRIVSYFFILRKRVIACQKTMQEIQFISNKLYNYAQGKYFEKERFHPEEQLYDYPFFYEDKTIALRLHYFYQTIYRSSLVFKDLLQKLTLLSLQIMDLTNSACMNPLNPNDDVGLREIFVEEDMVGKLREILETQLKENQDTLRNLFKEVHTIHPSLECTFELFMQLVRKAHDTASHINTISELGSKIAALGSFTGWGQKEVRDIS